MVLTLPTIWACLLQSSFHELEQHVDHLAGELTNQWGLGRRRVRAREHRLVPEWVAAYPQF